MEIESRGSSKDLDHIRVNKILQTKLSRVIEARKTTNSIRNQTCSIHPLIVVSSFASLQYSNLQETTFQPDPTIMLLMGIKMSLTKNPTNPITTKPIAVRKATLVNSLRSGLWQRLTRRTLSLAKSLNGSKTLSRASIATIYRERERESAEAERTVKCAS